MTNKEDDNEHALKWFINSAVEYCQSLDNLFDILEEQGLSPVEVLEISRRPELIQQFLKTSTEKHK